MTMNEDNKSFDLEFQKMVKILNSNLHLRLIENLEVDNVVPLSLKMSDVDKDLFDESGHLKAAKVYTMLINHVNVPFVYALAAHQLPKHELMQLKLGNLLVVGAMSLAQAVFLALIESYDVRSKPQFAINSFVDAVNELFLNNYCVVDVDRTLKTLFCLNAIWYNKKMTFSACSPNNTVKRMIFAHSVIERYLVEKLLTHNALSMIRPPCVRVIRSGGFGYSICHNHDCTSFTPFPSISRIMQ